jgi:drug/metabolite transporter (DMT)-like permease
LNRPLLVGSGLIVGAASLFGTLGFVSRMTAGLGLGSVAFVFWRAGLATVLLVGYAGATGGGGVERLRQLRGRRRAALFAAAMLGALLNVAIFAAFLRTTIAVALICFYTFPAIVTLAAVPLYGDQLDRRRLLALGVSSAGLILVLLAPALGASGLAIDPVGVGLALLAAFCQSCFLLLSGRGYGPLSSLDVSTIVISAAVLVGGALLLVGGDPANALLPFSEPALWPWIAVTGIFGAAIPTTAFLAGLARIGPARTAILMTFEPLTGVLLAALMLGERPVALQLVGGAGVLAAAAILQASPGRVPVEVEAPVV